ncbi:MAG: response regulator [Desulfuromonadales bacterium]
MAKRIIVIDDSHLLLAMAGDVLKEAGYDVITTDSGIEANQYIYSAQTPDLILIDVMMPLLNGDRKVRLLKEREKSRHIPVVLMSSKEEDELRELVRQSGANGYIRKPFNPQSFLKQVTSFLVD